MVFAYIFVGLAVLIGGFQIALAAGAPLGEFTLGGKFPGRLPAQMRLAALAQIAVLALFVAIVVARAGIAFDGLLGFARVAIWVIVAFFVMGSILNLSSPSKKEKMLMGPLNLVALICVVMVAIG